MSEANSLGTPKISRRKFLGEVGNLAKGAVAAGVVKNVDNHPILGSFGKAVIQEGSIDSEKEKFPEITVMDIFEFDPLKDRLLKKYFPAADFSEKEMLSQMGVDDPKTLDGLQKAEPQNEKDSILILLNALQQRYENHGREVSEVIRKLPGLLNELYIQNPEKLPNNPLINKANIVESIDIDGLDYDDEGNPTLWISVDRKRIEEMIAQTEDLVINMSFELGRIPTTYQMYRSENSNEQVALSERSVSSTINGTRTTTTRYFSDGREVTDKEYERLSVRNSEKTIKLIPPEKRSFAFIDGYAANESTTEKNLEMLVDIARKYPKKFFAAAGGNSVYLNGRHTPDIRQARKKLEEQGVWPENLVIVGVDVAVGEEGSLSSYRGPGTEGSDIYVNWRDLNKLGFGQAASFATPVVSELARQLRRDKKLTPSDVKKSLLEMCIVEERSGSTPYRVLDLEKAKKNYPQG